MALSVKIVPFGNIKLLLKLKISSAVIIPGIKDLVLTLLITTPLPQASNLT
jgi:hypothetical protein